MTGRLGVPGPVLRFRIATSGLRRCATGFAVDPPHTFSGAFERRLENGLLFADGFERGRTNLWSH